MKKALVFGLALAMGMLVACGDDSSTNANGSNTDDSVNAPESSASNESGKQGGDEGAAPGSSSSVEASVDPGSSSSVEASVDPESSSSVEASVEQEVAAFFPVGYKAADVVAWYATDLGTDVEKDRTKHYIDAVFLFKDGTFLATECQLKEKPDRTTFEKKIAMTGTWEGLDDGFENGSFEVEFEGTKMPLEIVDGVFSINPEGDRGMTYTLMSSDVPEASEPVDVELKNSAD